MRAAIRASGALGHPAPSLTSARPLRSRSLFIISPPEVHLLEGSSTGRLLALVTAGALRYARIRRYSRGGGLDGGGCAATHDCPSSSPRLQGSAPTAASTAAMAVAAIDPRRQACNNAQHVTSTGRFWTVRPLLRNRRSRSPRARRPTHAQSSTYTDSSVRRVRAHWRDLASGRVWSFLPAWSGW
jgi:hypothetical protein